MPFGKSGVESLTVRPILPSKGGSGFGNTLGVWTAAARGNAADASANAAMKEAQPSRLRRLIATLPTADAVSDFLWDESSLMVSSRMNYRWVPIREDYRQFRSEEHTSELQSLRHLVCRLLLEKKKTKTIIINIHKIDHE